MLLLTINVKGFGGAKALLKSIILSIGGRTEEEYLIETKEANNKRTPNPTTYLRKSFNEMEERKSNLLTRDTFCCIEASIRSLI